MSAFVLCYNKASEKEHARLYHHAVLVFIMIDWYFLNIILVTRQS